RRLEGAVFVGHVPRGCNAKLEHRDCNLLVGVVVSPCGRTGTYLWLFTPDKGLHVGPAPKDGIRRAWSRTPSVHLCNHLPNSRLLGARMLCKGTDRTAKQYHEQEKAVLHVVLLKSEGECHDSDYQVPQGAMIP